jgi:PhnB protein
MPVKPIPDGYHTVTPYLMLQDADKFVDFMARAFDAKVEEQLKRPDGKVGHTELRIGDSVIMLSEAVAPHEPSSVMLHLYVEDADAAFERAVAAGASVVSRPADQFYGDHAGCVKEPTGHNTLWIATHVEDMSPDERKRRATEAMKKMS